MYRYLGAGLSNVFLKNGYKVVKTPFGEGVKIHDVDGLHDALAEAIVESPNPVNGQEFRFLRNQLELSQAALAELLGTSEQSVARWETGKSKKVDATAERLLRVLYKSAKCGEKKFAPVLKMLQELECAPGAPRQFVATEVRDSWRAKAEAAPAA